MNIENKKINEKNEIIKIFFKTIIIKEFLYNDKFKSYYINFLNIDNTFNEQKFDSIINDIYNLISKYDVTSTRPNNVGKLTKKDIENVINIGNKDYKTPKGFFEEILIQIQGGNIDLKNQSSVTNKNLKIVESGIRTYIEKCSCSIKIENTIEETAEKIYKIIA